MEVRYMPCLGEETRDPCRSAVAAAAQPSHSTVTASWRSRRGPVTCCLLLAGACLCAGLALSRRGKEMQHSVTAGTTEVDVDATLGLDASSQHAQHSNAPLSEAEVAAKVNGFGLSLLGAVHKASNESNVFISPFSLVSTLGLAALGATPGGAAQRELWGALMLETGEAASFFDGLRSISDRLMVAGDVDLLNANSVWSKASIKESFIGKAHKTLDAEAKPLPTDPAPINAWVKEATNGMIPSIIDRIDPLTVAILVNAIYFKGEWTTKFDRARSVLGSFSLSDKDRRPCAMMRRDDKRMLYAEKNDLQVVELPYGEGGVVATVLLPRQAGAVSLPALVQHSKDIGAAGLQNLLDRLAPTHVSLQLPRFNLEYGVKDLTPELESSFGIHKALYGRGEFAAMSNDSDVHLSAVLHKAKVEVNEEGTKAAAATAGIMNTRAIIMPQKEVIVDRPFLFLIRDRPTGLLLFAGAVERPELDTNL